MTSRGEGSEESGVHRRFHRHLREHPELIPAGARVVAAVSGGPDSMALLDLLTRPPPRGDAGGAGVSGGGWEVVAAHFDHALRPGSAGEARSVIEWCRERDVPWVAGCPPRRLDRDPAACRRARYEFLEGAVRAAGAARLVTAHHADDQAETVLFRLLRGTGLRGLAGMPRRRGSLVRPLLPFGGQELRAYASARGLPVHRDPSNRDPRYARTRMRHALLPALEARDPDIRGKLLEVARLARASDESLERLAEGALSACRLPAGEGRVGGRTHLSRERFLRLAPELRARVLRRLARAENVRLTRGGTRSAMEFITDARSGARMDLGEGLRLGRDFDVLWVGRHRDAGDEDREATIRLPGTGRAEARIGGRDYRVTWGPAPPGADRPGGRTLRLEPGEVSGGLELRVRGRKPGDTIRLPGGTRKLKDVLVDRRVPRSVRSRLAVFADADDGVRWVPGVCAAVRADGDGPARGEGAEDGWWVTIAEGERAEPEGR